MLNNTLLTRLEERVNLPNNLVGFQLYAPSKLITEERQRALSRYITDLFNAAPALIAIARAAHDAKDCLACICDSCEALRSALAAADGIKRR